MPGKGGNHKRLEKAWIDSPQNLSRELVSTDMLTELPEMEENKFGGRKPSCWW